MEKQIEQLNAMVDELPPQKDDIFSPEVSIVMPCLNEAETLATCIREAQASLDASGIQGEIIIADNGSDDGSQSIATSLGARVVSVSEKGYGSALQRGIQASRGRYIIMGDSDASYNFGHVPRFVEKLREGYDLVMGNRFRGGIEPGAMPWKHRYIGNPVLSGIGRLFFHCPAGDFHCGLRGFSKAAIEELELNTRGMEFASEMVIKATLNGLRITEIPTVLRPDGRSRPPHLRSWRDGWRHLRFMLLFCPMWLFLIPGAVLLIAGILCLLVLGWYGTLRIGQVGLSVNTALAAAMTALLGYQLLLAGTFARGLGAFVGSHSPHPLFDHVKRWVSLECGIASGIALVVVGICVFCYAMISWQQTGFGELSRELTVRAVIPAVVLVVFGCQTIFGSFFLSLLTFVRKAKK